MVKPWPRAIVRAEAVRVVETGMWSSCHHFDPGLPDRRILARSRESSKAGVAGARHGRGPPRLVEIACALSILGKA